ALQSLSSVDRFVPFAIFWLVRALFLFLLSLRPNPCFPSGDFLSFCPASWPYHHFLKYRRLRCMITWEKHSQRYFQALKYCASTFQALFHSFAVHFSLQISYNLRPAEASSPNRSRPFRVQSSRTPLSDVWFCFFLRGKWAQKYKPIHVPWPSLRHIIVPIA